MYSIKAIASITGLSTETLRAWERRYQAIVPERDSSGRRFYSQQEMERLTMLANLTQKGHAISKVSGFSNEGLQKLLTGADEKSDSQSPFVEQIVKALQDYRIDRCEQLLKRALMANEPLAYVRDVLTPALNHVGKLWQEEKLNIAQEHMFSACVKRLLLGMVNALHNFSANRPSMLFVTPSGEPHEFGILMCCLLAAEQQYNCYYLGANVPAADMLDATIKLGADVMVLSLVKNPLDTETAKELHSLVNALKTEKIALWLGGKGADDWCSQQKNVPKNCEMIMDIDAFYFKAQQRRFVG